MTYLFAAMIDNQVHDKLHPLRVTSIADRFPILHRSIPGIDRLIVGDIIAHVGLRRLVDGREPDDINAEVFEVGDFR